MWRLIVMWVMMVSTVKGQGVHTGLRSGQAVLGSRGQTLWGELAYPAATRSTDAALGVFGENRFMTDLNFFELGFRAGLGKQPLQFHMYCEGNPALYDLAASASIAKKISAELSIAARVGYTLTQAKGYASRGHPVAGLGAFFSFTDKCRWALQADGINSFFTGDGDKNFLVRTAVGYKVSELASVSVELVKEDQHPVQTVTALSYSFMEGLSASVGYSLQLGSFLFGLNFEHGGAAVMMTASYHGSLGPGAGLSLLYQIKRKE
jgi:hypothetical protein